MTTPAGVFADRSWRVPDLVLTRQDTALLVVDLQYYDAHPDYGIIQNYQRTDPSSVEYFVNRLQSEVIPNTRRLLATFRQATMEVIYTRIQALTRDGRDRSLEHKRLNILVPRGCKDADILSELAPVGDEIVIDKTSGSAFNGSNIDYVLRNLGMANLIVCGVVTSGCVELTACDAFEKGYGVVIVRDAVATWTPEMERYSLERLADSFAKIKSTEQVVELLHPLGETLV